MRSANPRITAPKVRAMKAKGEQVVCLTVYDYTGALLVEASGADVALVGDSLGTVIQGRSTTTTVTLDEIAYHVRAVASGLGRPLLVADLPFGSYGGSIAQAVESSTVLIRAGAQAVKLEGVYTEEIRAIIKTGVPVMGHLGMTPQSVNNFGGHRIQGKGDDAERIVQQAKELEEAGVFAIVLELVPATTAAKVSAAVSVPTIGIGAGPECDGQIQVLSDVLGLWPTQFRHAKRYSHGLATFTKALRRYAKEVRSGEFPTKEHSS